uniref:Uncharacterized protein n=1 Tax=Arundo donax TaxID=35708 RepID=A0A0A9G4V5_ARUDO
MASMATKGRVGVATVPVVTPSSMAIRMAPAPTDPHPDLSATCFMATRMAPAPTKLHGAGARRALGGHARQAPARNRTGQAPWHQLLRCAPESSSRCRPAARRSLTPPSRSSTSPSMAPQVVLLLPLTMRARAEPSPLGHANDSSFYDPAGRSRAAVAGQDGGGSAAAGVEW